MFKKVLNCDQFWIGEKKGIVIDGVRVLIIHTETGIYAFNDFCPHAGALLSEGFLREGIITCARHGWQFDAYTGKGINPINTQLCQYPVTIDEAGDIWIDIGVET